MDIDDNLDANFCNEENVSNKITENTPTSYVGNKKIDNKYVNNRNKRPQICITENYIKKQQQRTVPGNSTYANITKYGKKILVIGDSHIRRIQHHKFNKSFVNARSYVRSFSGAKVEDLKHYVIPSLQEQQPELAVIHVGSNSLNCRN